MIDLHLGDCFDLLPTLPADSVDLLLTDPPYATTQCPWDKPIAWDRFWRETDRTL